MLEEEEEANQGEIGEDTFEGLVNDFVAASEARREADSAEASGSGGSGSGGRGSGGRGGRNVPALRLSDLDLMPSRPMMMDKDLEKEGLAQLELLLPAAATPRESWLRGQCCEGGGGGHALWGQRSRRQSARGDLQFAIAGSAQYTEKVARIGSGGEGGGGTVASGMVGSDMVGERWVSHDTDKSDKGCIHNLLGGSASTSTVTGDDSNANNKNSLIQNEMCWPSGKDKGGLRMRQSALKCVGEDCESGMTPRAPRAMVMDTPRPMVMDKDMDKEGLLQLDLLLPAATTLRRDGRHSARGNLQPAATGGRCASAFANVQMYADEKPAAAWGGRCASACDHVHMYADETPTGNRSTALNAGQPAALGRGGGGSHALGIFSFRTALAMTPLLKPSIGELTIGQLAAGHLGVSSLFANSSAVEVETQAVAAREREMERKRALEEERERERERGGEREWAQFLKEREWEWEYAKKKEKERKETGAGRDREFERCVCASPTCMHACSMRACVGVSACMSPCLPMCHLQIFLESFSEYAECLQGVAS